jgi:hypothetical protein
VYDLLRPLLAVARQASAARPIRVVDIGCGTGFVVRWLAAHATLGDDVEVVGVDYNAALLAEARRLAAVEHLPCTFVVANAFRLAPPAAIYLSTGVVHHVRGTSLDRFFAQHDQPATVAFAHIDFQPSPLTPIGAWLFHAVRMRQPLARHDGVLSALRAHTGETLLAAARMGAPGFRCAIYGARLGPSPVRRVFHALVGLRPALASDFTVALGDRRGRLGPLQ